jgi:Holliday junction resolvasome RuvABC DNA-binding subunit
MRWPSSRVPSRPWDPTTKKAADAIAALEALGSKPKDAQNAIRAAIVMLGSDKPVDELVRAALQKGK